MAKGAPVEFVIPPDGAVAAPQPWGIVKEAPHPAAAQLFMDWFLGVPGQTGNAEAAVHPLAARRCAATAGRRQHQHVQGADPHRLARLRADPRAVRARVGQDHRAALKPVDAHSGNRPATDRDAAHRAAVRRAGDLSDRLPDQ